MGLLGGAMVETRTAHEGCARHLRRWRGGKIAEQGLGEHQDVTRIDLAGRGDHQPLGPVLFLQPRHAIMARQRSDARPIAKHGAGQRLLPERRFEGIRQAPTI